MDTKISMPFKTLSISLVAYRTPKASMQSEYVIFLYDGVPYRYLKRGEQKIMESRIVVKFSKRGKIMEINKKIRSGEEERNG